MVNIYNPVERIREIQSYFANKAQQYDDVESQPYWAFSDELLWKLLLSFVIPKVANKQCPKILDAGAGTGRWSQKLLRELPDAYALLVDISKDMLAVAQQKFKSHGLADRASFRLSNLDQDPINDAAFDLAICFHNVLAFVADARKVIEKLAVSLRPGGVLAIVVPNYYHAAFFSLKTGQWNELDRIIDRGLIKFAPECPEMRLFFPSQLVKLLEQTRLIEISVHGFPVTIYPGMEETQIEGSSKSAVHILTDNDRRQKLLDLELNLVINAESASRGNNLLAIAHKGL